MTVIINSPPESFLTGLNRLEQIPTGSYICYMNMKKPEYQYYIQVGRQLVMALNLQTGNISEHTREGNGTAIYDLKYATIKQIEINTREHN